MWVVKPNLRVGGNENHDFSIFEYFLRYIAIFFIFLIILMIFCTFSIFPKNFDHIMVTYVCLCMKYFDLNIKK